MATRGEADVRPLPVLLALFEAAGFCLLQLEDRTASHAGVAGRLLDALRANRSALLDELGAPAVDGLTQMIATWADLMATRRVTMLALVAERAG